MFAQRPKNDASISRILEVEIERRILARIEKRESAVIKEVIRLEIDPHSHKEGLLLEILKHQRYENGRIEKSKKPAISTKKIEHRAN